MNLKQQQSTWNASETTWNKDGRGIDTLMHAGNLLSGASAALQIGRRVIVTSPEGPGGLFCDVA